MRASGGADGFRKRHSIPFVVVLGALVSKLSVVSVHGAACVEDDTRYEDVHEHADDLAHASDQPELALGEENEE